MMSSTVRSLRAFALVAASAGALLVGAAPAQAATPLSVTVNCESIGSYTAFCHRTVAGGVAPYTTKWLHNGTYLASQDNKAWIKWGCSRITSNSYTAVVYDATGLKVQGVGSMQCSSTPD
jgi:hypothetical protein